MTGRIEARLAERGVALPTPAAPAGNYTPYVRTGSLVFISGQIAQDASGPMKGRLGVDATVADGQKAARACGLFLIAQLKAACDGDLDRVVRVVKLTGFVNAAPEFGEHPSVINGCSDLMVEVFGDAGVHARAAVGAGSLPFGVAVEIEGVFEIA